MRKSFISLKVVIIFCIIFAFKTANAQLGFCQGNSGDPIFTETFGTGAQNIALPAGTTTYSYAGNQNPNDGFYTVSSTSNYFDWFTVTDHTENDTNGRMLIVNSSFSAGEFYKTTINGLCENTTYEFSSWLVNLTPPNGFCGAGAIPINVSFEIWDTTETTLLASGTTGNIFGTTATDWNQYALVFQSTIGQTSVVLKMINNAPGGCGNDLAIDDIVFKSCGDSIDVNDGTSSNSVTLCSTQTPYSEIITAAPDNVVFNDHFYQWQFSTDNLNWVDIPSETSASISVIDIITTTYYRAKVAEYPSNLNNNDCITFSDVYEIIINQAPPEPATECWETATFSDLTCSWTITGSQPLAPTNLECWQSVIFNNSTCDWDVTGVQPVEPTTECWELATFNTVSCVWEVSGTQPIQPTIECWETTTFNNITCVWDITGTQPNEPIDLECWQTAAFDETICDWEITGEQPEEPIVACWQTTVFNSSACVWEVSGTQPVQPTNLECWQSTTFNDLVCEWEIIGEQPNAPVDLFCWQTTAFNSSICEWEILGEQPLVYSEEFLFLCEDETIEIEAISTIDNPSYLWSSGEITSSIIIDSEGIYTVEVTDGCLTEIINFIVTLIEIPQIESVSSDGSSIIVSLINDGDYVYSIDGINYQYTNSFGNVQSELYTIYIKSNSCDFVVTQEYFHFYTQKFITPNGDGINDVFIFNVAQYFATSEVSIFDRYGKLLYSVKNSNGFWDGTFNNAKLPTSDYWYRIVLDDKKYVGHFTLKR
ncbi:T9SS type B sorting domain-containing protein [Winogradskyella sp. 4-2091]|uniref:T9SS type B sorting domain-containing protein n=1 Tax=Winogradskyella sp. 4-2091 TaxID=3381659 RepID=UPI00389204CD